MFLSDTGGHRSSLSEIEELASWAEGAGLSSGWVPYLPWSLDAFVALAAADRVTDRIELGTAVVPTYPVHPMSMARSALSLNALLGGRFTLGVGSGEALNEHILGGPWPTVDVRLEMLEEAVALMRELWTGEVVSWDGKHYRVDHARLYTLPEQPPEVYVSGFGPKAIDVAARIGDGFVTTQADADAVRRFKDGAMSR